MFAYSRCIISKAYLSKSTLNQQICHPWEGKTVRRPSLREWWKTTLQTQTAHWTSRKEIKSIQIYSHIVGLRAMEIRHGFLPRKYMKIYENIKFREDFGSSKALRHTNVLTLHDSFFWVSRVSNPYLSQISHLTTHFLQHVSRKRSKICETISFRHQFDPSDPAVFSNLGATKTTFKLYRAMLLYIKCIMQLHLQVILQIHDMFNDFTKLY